MYLQLQGKILLSASYILPYFNNEDVFFQNLLFSLSYFRPTDRCIQDLYNGAYYPHLPPIDFLPKVHTKIALNINVGDMKY